MKKMKRIGAIIGIILILSLFLLLIISAVIAKENNSGLFMAALFSIIAIPIMIYGYIAVYKYVHRNDPKADDENPKQQ